jgi:RNA polymerase sigma-54 factor
MNNKLSITMRLDQRLAMNQQLRQAISLLQYNTIELKQVIQQHIESNPLIDIDEAESAEENATYDMGSYTYSASYSKRYSYSEETNSIENYAQQKSLREYLIEQTVFCHFDSNQQILAEAIIDGIDAKGYLSMSLNELQVATQAPIEKIEEILAQIKTFDPIGIASEDMRECLSTQLKACPEKNRTWELLYGLISDFSKVISLENIKKLMKQLNISQHNYRQAMYLIRSLNPYPCARFEQDVNVDIEPELYVKKIFNTWQVFLTDSLLTHIKINKQYHDLIKKHKNHSSYLPLKRELEEARWLVNGLKKRNETLLAVATHILVLQEDFLEYGPSKMKPMNMTDIALALGLHESTVSRVTTGKYMSTPPGVYELKYFFSSHLSTKVGTDCSATAVKSFIKEILSQETNNQIYSDSEIADILQKKGINIARRTVTKYRESMHLLSSYQRQMHTNFPSSKELEKQDQLA